MKIEIDEYKSKYSICLFSPPLPEIWDETFNWIFFNIKNVAKQPAPTGSLGSRMSQRQKLQRLQQLEESSMANQV